MSDFALKRHDRLPSIQATLSSAGQPVNLTGAVRVFFIMRALSSGTFKVKTPAVIVDPPNGVVRYDWLPEDTDTSGDFQAEWQVDWLYDRSQTFPTLSYHSIRIEPDLDGV